MTNYYIKSKKYPPVVKDMVFDKEIRKFRYVYYQDDELEALLKHERGDRWYEEPWVDVWLNKQRHRPVRYRKRTKKKQPIVYPFDILQELIRFYKQRGYRKREVYRLLKQHHGVTQSVRRMVDQVYACVET